jgi:hypothetical protein
LGLDYSPWQEQRENGRKPDRKKCRNVIKRRKLDIKELVRKSSLI